MFDLTEADLAGGHVEGELVGVDAGGHAYRVGAEQGLDAAVRGYPGCRRSNRNADQPVAGEPPGVDRGRTEVVGVADADSCDAELPCALRSGPSGSQAGENAERAVGVDEQSRTAVVDHADTGCRIADTGRELVQILGKQPQAVGVDAA